MIKSMTAFGRAKHEGEARDITVEIKSVNSRFYDCNVKMPRAYLFLEERIKSYVQKKGIARAKVDVFLTIDNHTSDVSSLELDEQYAAAYVSALQKLSERFSLPNDITTMSVARNFDVFKCERAEADMEEEWSAICAVLDEALASHSAMRAAEGERIFADITAKLENVRAISNEVEKISESDTVGYRDRLETKLRAILADNAVTVDENRLLTECAIWADKIAIDEELVRLRSHFNAFYDIAKLGEPSGRKLDFLLQELNRETNTIGSKANNARIARLVVDMKGELEKIREQIQNIE